MGILLFVITCASCLCYVSGRSLAWQGRQFSLQSISSLYQDHVENVSSELYASNYELGLAIGRRYKANIVARLKALGPQLRKAQDYIETPDGRDALESLGKATRASYPQYWREMEGIAHGSDTEINQIILLNFRQELVILSEQGKKSTGVDDCSDYMLSYNVSKETQNPVALLGHNEDNSKDTVKTSYFAFANVTGRSWTAFTYAGELSTAAFGWNSDGVCFTLNALYAKEVNIHGVGRNFVSRSILDANSLEEALQKIGAPNQATGHNINVIGLDERKIVTIETGPGNISDSKVISNESYFHANAFLRANVSQAPGPSSEHREKRAQELPVPYDRKGILTVLGDTKDKEYPIWRSGSDEEYTLVTSLFDVYKETVEIIYGNPKINLTSLSTTLPLRLEAARLSLLVS